jgi:hypothetical protein
VRLDGVSLDLSDEVAFEFGTGLEPALAPKQLVHRLHRATIGMRP